MRHKWSLRGEQFVWLDLAGGEQRDKLSIGCEEVVISQLPGQDPGDLLEGAWRNVCLAQLRGEEVNFQLFRKVGVLMADAGDSRGFDECGTELFAELASKSLFEGLAGADFPAGKFPLERRGVVLAALADKQATIGTFDDSGDDVQHRGCPLYGGIRSVGNQAAKKSCGFCGGLTREIACDGV